MQSDSPLHIPKEMKKSILFTVIAAFLDSALGLGGAEVTFVGRNMNGHSMWSDFSVRKNLMQYWTETSSCPTGVYSYEFVYWKYKQSYQCFSICCICD